MKWRFSGRFFVYDSGEEGKCGLGKENQSQQGRRDAKTGRMDGNRRERMTEWEERKGKRGKQGLEKRKKRKEKEEDGDWKRGRRRRTTGSLQSETGRDNLLTVLLCYQQKGSRY